MSIPIVTTLVLMEHAAMPIRADLDLSTCPSLSLV